MAPEQIEKAKRLAKLFMPAEKVRSKPTK